MMSESPILDLGLDDVHNFGIFTHPNKYVYSWFFIPPKKPMHTFTNSLAEEVKFVESDQRMIRL